MENFKLKQKRNNFFSNGESPYGQENIIVQNEEPTFNNTNEIMVQEYQEPKFTKVDHKGFTSVTQRATDFRNT